MSDISKLYSLVAGKMVPKDLAANTLVLGNAKIGGATNYATFDVTAVTGSATITVPNGGINLGNVLLKDLAEAKIFVGNGSGVATAVAVSGDVTILATGAVAIGEGKVTNAMIAASAGIPYSKLTIADGDLSIAKTSGLQTALDAKLAKALTETYIFVGNASGVAAGVAVSGDLTVSNAGAFSIGSGKISNTHVASDAAIAESKLNLSYSTSSLNTAISNHTGSTSNPHSVTASQVGLGNVTNDAQLKAADLDTDGTLAANSDSKIASQKAIKTYVSSQVGGAIVGAIVYKGTFDASASNFDAITNPKQGWMYKVTVAGTIDSVLYSVGDNMYINKDVTGHPVTADIDKIDNTESADLLRNTMLTSGQIFVGNSSNVVTAVTPSGDVTIGNTGVTAIGEGKVTNAMIAASAGIPYSKLTIADSDLSIAKTSGLQTALDAKLAKALTETYIFVGNASGVAAGVAVSGDLTVSNAGAFSIGSGKISNTHIASDAAIAESKLNLSYSTSSLNTAISNHTGSTSNPHSVTASQVGLGNVTNDAQLKAADLDTDGTLAANSDSKIASQKAIKTYVASNIGAVSSLQVSVVVGETLAASTTVALRISLDGETAGRYYKTSNVDSDNKFYAVGLIKPASELSASDTAKITLMGEVSSSADFLAADIGKPVYIGAAGALTLTAPTASDTAVVKVGTVSATGEGTSKIMVQGIQYIGSN